MDTILYIFHGFRLTNQIVAFGASDPLFCKSGYLGSDFILYMNSYFHISYAHGPFKAFCGQVKAIAGLLWSNSLRERPFY